MSEACAWMLGRRAMDVRNPASISLGPMSMIKLPGAVLSDPASMMVPGEERGRYRRPAKRAARWHLLGGPALPACCLESPLCALVGLRANPPDGNGFRSTEK